MQKGLVGEMRVWDGIGGAETDNNCQGGRRLSEVFSFPRTESRFLTLWREIVSHITMKYDL